MNKAKRVVNYYVLIAKLKEVIRKGWKNACVSKERLESVADHVYSTENLAIAMYYVYKPDIDLKKVIMMLAVHEIEEIIIGDIAVSDPEYKHAKDNAHNIVESVLATLGEAEEVKDLIFEFDEKVTKEAKFAFLCDKLDCDIQAKLYSEQCGFDKEELRNKNNFFTSHVVNGNETLADIWLPWDEHIYQDDEDFKSVFDYVFNNEILPYRSEFENDIKD